jgi:site-specific DNA-methyltransferase (adenine-specific)
VPPPDAALLSRARDVRASVEATLEPPHPRGGATLPREYLNRIIHGDCIDVLRRLPAACVDLVVTDPPYLVRYRSRRGQQIMNDGREDWLEPAFAGIYRALRTHAFCVSFYGWAKVERFMRAWKRAGFYPVGHLVWTKRYPSNSQYVAYHHETAYLLAKGRPPFPAPALPDVMPWQYTGNRLHPMEKSVAALEPLITTLSRRGEIVLDPFCGSGSTAEAASRNERHFLGIELDEEHWRTASERLRRRT